MTYGDLAAAVEELVAVLRDTGIGPGQRVGVGLDRCPELIVALVAVLESGAAYVPLDPSYPAARLERMAADAGLAALLTVRRLAGRWPADTAPFQVEIDLGRDLAPARRAAPAAGGPDDRLT